LAAILRGRKLNSRIALRATAGGGKSYAFVLDFNILPRLAPPKKSMEEYDLNPLEGRHSKRSMIPSHPKLQSALLLARIALPSLQ
jgi:hypothetical protein